MEKKDRANERQEFDTLENLLNSINELPEESIEKVAFFVQGMLAVAGKKTA